MKVKVRHFLLPLTAYFFTLAVARGQSIESMGEFVPFSLSGDGSIVMGGASAPGSQPVRWEDGVLVSHNQGTLVTTDGLVTFGQKDEKGYRWANGAGQVISPPWGQIEEHLGGTNGDGSVAVGSARLLSGSTGSDSGATVRQVGYIWRNGSYQEMEVEKHTSVRATSGDGSAFGGSTGPFLHESQRAVIWAGGSPIKLGAAESYVTKISANGTLALVQENAESYLYEIATGEKTPVGGTATDMNGDGTIVVGYSRNWSDLTPFLWTPDSGSKELFEALAADFGVDVAGWTMDSRIDPNYTKISADGRVIVGRGTGPGGSKSAWRVEIETAELAIAVVPKQASYTIDDELEIRVTITHPGGGPITYAFGEHLFTQEPEAVEGEQSILSFELVEPPKPFTLDEENPKWSITIPAKTAKPGVARLRAGLVADPSNGDPYNLEAEQEVVVSPIATEVAITNKRHHWNSTLESKWGERAKALNQQRRADGVAPYLNLIEIELRVTNKSEEPIENLSIQGVRDIMGYIQSTTLADPAVPLLPIRLYAPSGVEVDLTNPDDPNEVDDLTLQPEETATFAWLVEAFEIDPNVRVDPYDLEFTPLILGSQSGENLQASLNEPFSVRPRGPIVVNVTSDERDFDPDDGLIDVDPDTEGEQISLRAAIEYANQTPGLDRIEFDIPGDGVPEIKIGPPPEGDNIMATGTDGDLFLHLPNRDSPIYPPKTFTIVSALKSTEPVEIDGTTQSAGLVHLNGQKAINSIVDFRTSAINGLEIAGGESLVRGLVINRFPGFGLVLTENGKNQVSGNIIGMDPTGMVAFGNGSALKINRKVDPKLYDLNVVYNFGHQEFLPGDGGFNEGKILPVSRLYAGGILVNSPNNTIGGDELRERNLFSGHGKILNGLEFSREWYDAEHTTVTLFSSDVVISGLNAIDNEFVGNFVGTDALGNRSNESYNYRKDFKEIVSGILVSNGASNTILRRNLSPKIVIENAHETRILDNQVGLPTEPKGSIDRGGILLSFAASTLVQDNSISGGIDIEASQDTSLKNNIIEDVRALDIYKSSNTTIQGNRLGIDAEGNVAEESEMTDSWSIHMVGSTGVTLGGPNPGDGNAIGMVELGGYPHYRGVSIGNRTYDNVEGARLIHSGNSYFAPPAIPFRDGALVADLDNDGIDVIDFGDLDGKQNYPRLAFVTPENGNLRFEGNLDSHLGGSSYHLDFYKTPTPLPSGHGGAPMSYVGRGYVETDTIGHGQFDVVLPFSEFEIGDYFTVTATREDGIGETSEFARNRRIKDTLLHELNRDAYGDRNGDGIDDVDQDNVASFAAPNGADTTIEVSTKISPRGDSSLPIEQSNFTTLDNSNPRLENVLPETQASIGAPANYTYSNGVLTFEVLDLFAGATVFVKLIMANDATPDTLWVLQSDDTWTSTLQATIDGNLLLLTLTDGGIGDRDGEADGRIRAVLGPATALPPLPELNLSLTWEESSHTLSWPAPYYNSVLEFSPDLSPDSWWNLNSFLRLEDDLWQLTLPNPSPEENEPSFYRLRSVE